jgi:hypothetical protein
MELGEYNREARDRCCQIKKLGELRRVKTRERWIEKGISTFGILLCETLGKDLLRPTPVMQE